MKLSSSRISEDTGKPTNGLKKRSRQRKQFMNPLMVRPWMGEEDLTDKGRKRRKRGRVTLTGAICPQISPPQFRARLKGGPEVW